MPDRRAGPGRRPSLRPWRQTRSAETVRRIGAATMRLLGKKDFESISVDEIVETARTSKGAFYFRFATKADLLRYLGEDTFGAMSKEARAFFEAERDRMLPLGPFLEAFVGWVAAQYFRRRNLLRAFLQEARPGGDKVVVALVRAGSAESVQMLVQALRARTREIRHHDPELAIHTAVIVLGLTLRQACLFPEQLAMFPGLSLERFGAELKRMLCRYLKTASRPFPG